jgi:hypothetical protein
MKKILLAAASVFAFGLAGCVADAQSTDHASTADEALRFTVLSAYGEPCGGFSPNARTCAAGLACSHIDANGNFINPDIPGVCLEGYASRCGGFVPDPKVCAGGLECSHIDAYGNVINVDVEGYCLEGPGGPCHGLLANPKECAGGLRCVQSNPDVEGTCH